jgi:acyl-CoA hydrolase
MPRSEVAPAPALLLLPLAGEGRGEGTGTRQRPVEARMTEIVFPDHTNHLGTLFGGQALAWMDKAAFIAASRYARCTVVTARSEQIDFHVAVPKGALVELVARVVGTGRTSLQVEVEMHREDLLSGDAQLATRGRFTMVALDRDGLPTAVPALAA